jgi:hypothetical protein
MSVPCRDELLSKQDCVGILKLGECLEVNEQPYCFMRQAENTTYQLDFASIFSPKWHIISFKAARKSAQRGTYLIYGYKFRPLLSQAHAA